MVKELIRVGVIGTLLIGFNPPAASYGDGHEGYRPDHGFGPRSTLPVPAAFVFGGLAVSAAIAVGRRRRSLKRKAGFDSPGEGIDQNK